MKRILFFLFLSSPVGFEHYGGLVGLFIPQFYSTGYVIESLWVIFPNILFLFILMWPCNRAAGFRDKLRKFMSSLVLFFLKDISQWNLSSVVDHCSLNFSHLKTELFFHSVDINYLIETYIDSSIPLNNDGLEIPGHKFQMNRYEAKCVSIFKFFSFENIRHLLLGIWIYWIKVV